jgi:hypothetical protein
MDRDVMVEVINHYGFTLLIPHGKLIATAPQVDGLFVLHRVVKSEAATTVTDINSILLALKATGYAFWPDAAKRILWHRGLAHVGLQAFQLVPNVTNAPEMTG